MLRDLKDESSFFNKESCLFLVKREIFEVDAIRDSNEIMKTIKTILESLFFSNEFIFSMIRSSIMKSFSMKLFFNELMKLFSDDAKTLRRFEIFFAFVVTSMTKTINFSAYLFSQFLDQFIEI